MDIGNENLTSLSLLHDKDPKGRKCGGRMVVQQCLRTKEDLTHVEGPCSRCGTIFSFELPLMYFEFLDNLRKDLNPPKQIAAAAPMGEDDDYLAFARDYDDQFLKDLKIEPIAGNNP